MNNRFLDADDEILAEINSGLKNSPEADKEPVDIGGLLGKIHRAVMEVSRELGCGFLETVYENALMIELRKQGLRARNHVPIKAYYKGFPVGEYYAHIIVEETIIIELKMVDEIQKAHETQLINILKATGYTAGLLVNFANDKVELRRFVL
ncbi:MAG TPA: GxxExxY protein [Syntrophorhabdaceae bacterium]|nr:GxxExxY protein [Syntrophorhabdaceae bacterium]